MLNDLVLPKPARKSFRGGGSLPRFASRLPEPFDDDKVFRFEHVSLIGSKLQSPIDYASLSDGEHQLAQILGIFAMVSSPNSLFLLDEPESHSNPQWRVEFISSLMDLMTSQGNRRSRSPASRQDALMTTHAPFVPSDMDKERVLIFSKDQTTKEIRVRRPLIQTFGTSFEAILEECFGVTPPISGEARNEIARLRRSKSMKNVASGMKGLGYSLEKALLADHLRTLKKTRK
jgi:restriction system-associated AAA family ATPase